MLSLINGLLKGLSDKHQNWDKLIVGTLKNEEGNDKGINALEDLTMVLKQIIEMLKNEDVSIDEIEKLFEEYECKEYAIRYINTILRTYHSFDALRNLEKDDIYKAKQCVDQIWESYILRFNPYYDNQENILLKESEYKSVAREIERITEVCIEHNFHVFAILKQFEDKSGLSSELCGYISKKVDMDFEKLQLSYIIYNLSER